MFAFLLVTLSGAKTLTNGDISNKNTVIEMNEFDTIHEITEGHFSNDEYGKFATAHMEAKADYLPTKPRVK